MPISKRPLCKVCLDIYWINYSDFIVDTLEAWWENLDTIQKQATQQIQLKIDNGLESSGMRTQFLKRMVEFTEQIGKPIQLLYYPPYHSKYNPIERCWGILELHWNGTKLIRLILGFEDRLPAATECLAAIPTKPDRAA